MICLFDVLTGPEVAPSLFYLVPVIFCSWHGSRRDALYVALVAALLWLVADISTRNYVSLFPLVWNSASRFLLFFAAAIMTHTLRRDRLELKRTNKELRNLMRAEAALARTDSITNLPNARSLEEALEREIARCRRTGKSICVACIDLDNFKSINDHYGHVAGDSLLRRVSESIRDNIRASDFPARVGGDEFVVLLWEISVADVEEVGKRFVDSITACGRDFPNAKLGASVGIVWLERPGLEVSELIRKADDLMYQAKRNGKGQIAFEIVRSPQTVVTTAVS